jgi:uncharacterized damage-inducible protein DinB
MTRRNELIKALETTPRDLARTFRGIDPTTQEVRPAPKQWSVSDILSHLFFVEERYLKRLIRVAKEDNPSLAFIFPDETSHDLTASLSDLLDGFNKARAQTLQFLRSLSYGDWQRTATFEDGRKTNLRYLVQTLVDHDTEHLNQLIEIKTQSNCSG